VNYLVDTNVLSEPQQKIPSLKVIEWLRHHEAQLYTSTIVIAEIAYGIDDLPLGRKRTSASARDHAPAAAISFKEFLST
jgi:predicted nucleic acid-binding protein